MVIIKRDLVKRNRYMYETNYVNSPFEKRKKNLDFCTYEDIEAFAMEPLAKYIMYDAEFRSLRVLSRVLLIGIISDAKKQIDDSSASKIYCFRKSKIDYESFIGVKKSTFKNLFDELLAMEYIIPVDIDIFCISLL